MSRESSPACAESEHTGGDDRILHEEERDVKKMIGDVNLFFKGSPDDEDFEVEAEIMIAGMNAILFHLILSLTTF